MLVNFERRICYLAHAKTASRATSQVLKERCGFVAVTDHHAGWLPDVRDDVGDMFSAQLRWFQEDPATFLYLMTIRNPWDVIASWYVDSANHIRYDRIGPEWFEAFRKLHPKLFPETDLWPYLEKEPPGIVARIKYEEMQAYWFWVGLLFGVHWVHPLPLIGKTEGRADDYRFYYDDESRDWVAETFPNAVEVGGYEF